MFPYCSVVLPLLRFSLSFLSRLPGMDQSFSSWLHGQNSLFPIQTCSSATPEKSFCWGRPWCWLIHLIVSPQMWGVLSSRHAWCPDQASPAGLADMAGCQGLSCSALESLLQGGSGPVSRVHTCTVIIIFFNHNHSLLEALSSSWWSQMKPLSWPIWESCRA